MSYLVFPLLQAHDTFSFDAESLGFNLKDNLDKDNYEWLSGQCAVKSMGSVEYKEKIKKVLVDIQERSRDYEAYQLDWLGLDWYILAPIGRREKILSRLYGVETVRTKNPVDILKLVIARKNNLHHGELGHLFHDGGYDEFKIGHWFLFNEKKIFNSFVDKYNIKLTGEDKPLKFAPLMKGQNYSKSRQLMDGIVEGDYVKVKEIWKSFKNYNIYQNYDWNPLDLAYYTDRNLFFWLLENSNQKILKLNTKKFYGQNLLTHYFSKDMKVGLNLDPYKKFMEDPMFFSFKLFKELLSGASHSKFKGFLDKCPIEYNNLLNSLNGAVLSKHEKDFNSWREIICSQLLFLNHSHSLRVFFNSYNLNNEKKDYLYESLKRLFNMNSYNRPPEENEEYRLQEAERYFLWSQKESYDLEILWDLINRGRKLTSTQEEKNKLKDILEKLLNKKRFVKAAQQY